MDSVVSGGVDGRVRPMATVEKVADHFLARLARSGIPVPPPGRGRMDLGIGPNEEGALAKWTTLLPSHGCRPWIAIGPESKMLAKRWPVERFAEAVQRLVSKFDVWPVVFGGCEDHEVGERILAFVGRGYNAAGALTVRSAGAGLKRCKLYLGNDTGTMHLAAAVGLRCVAIFSARSAPGRWNPYGHGHYIFRTRVKCEGCELLECTENGMECIERIGVGDVVSACSEILVQMLEKPPQSPHVC